MRPLTLAALSASLFLFTVGINVSRAQTSSGPHSCPIVQTPPTAGEDLIAQKNYKDAETLYRAAIAKNPQDPETHFGLTRALIGLDQVTAAIAEADEMQTKFPGTALALTAQSEAAYRAGRPDDAQQFALKAARANGCEGRALLAFTNVAELWGFYARSWNYIQHAHAVRPNDELIRREWIWLMPRSQRAAALEQYIQGSNHIADDDRKGYNNALDHLKAHRAGECHISSTTPSVTVPMQPIYGDHTSPEAFGLDVTYNGKRRRMQIDTGASGITLTASAAHSLGLVPEIHRKVGGVGDEGDASSYLTHVKSIKIGDVEFSDCMVEVLEKHGRLDDIDGLIGMDVFNQWLVTLDYQNIQLHLDRLPPRPGQKPNDEDDDTPHDPYTTAPELKDFSNTIRIGHQIMLPAEFEKKQTHFLIMDTGASITDVSPEMAREVGKLSGSDIEVYGISGKAKKVWESKQAKLHVANLMLPPDEYYVLDTTSLSHSNGFETSGLFGLPTLQRLSISIDYRDNLVRLKYDPKRDRQFFTR
ncbi:MAG: retroviral-like aspartic protease family protein [Acidobacteriaceae bacterium]|nr:retroviral-like aspartic protease family protein [Acidobacteriaceae bacterium]